MLEIRYRLTSPGAPIPFTPWFARVPDGRVHATDVRMDAEGGSAVYVVMGGPDTDQLLEDVLALPGPSSTVWEPAGRKHGIGLVRAAWREPAWGFAPSPMHTAWTRLGDEAILACTILKEAVVQRVLVPEPADADQLWPALRDDMLRYAKATGAPIRLDLERVRRLASPLDAVPEKWPASFRLAFETGRFDEPPGVALEELARLVGLPERVVRAELGEIDG